MSMDTYGIIGFTTDNVGIDRRFYTGRTDTDPVLNVSYNDRRVDVYLNGIKLVGDHPGNSDHDYDINSQTGQGSSITIRTGVALVSADVIECIGYVSLAGNTVTTYNPTPASGGGWNVFTGINHVASDLVNVYLNGVLLDATDYTLDASANTLTIGGDTLTASDVVMVQVIGAMDNSNFVPVGGGTFSGNVTIADGTNDFDIASHDGSNGLKLGGTLVEATASNLNLLNNASSTNATVSKAVILNSSGNIALPNGKGIDFTANTDDFTSGLSSELLDDYEEGTWTITNTATPSAINCTYTKIGRIVFISGRVTAHAIDTASVEFGGLPFTVGNNEGKRGGGVMTYINQTVSVAFSVLPTANDTIFRFAYNNGQYLSITGGTLFLFNFNYFTD